MNELAIPKDIKIQSVINMKIEFFSDDQIIQMFNYILARINSDKRRKQFHERYYVLFKTLIWTGGRIDEVLALRPVDINFMTNTITLLTLKKDRRKNQGSSEERLKQKPKRYRVLPLHPDLKDALMTYFINFHIDRNSEERLFPMRRQAVNLYMWEMEKALGFKIHPHKFRHTFAVKAILNHVPLSVLQEWLAHASIFTTSVYTKITGIDTSQFMYQMK